MKIARAILIAFLGNYLVNNVIAAIAAFVPAGTGTITAQYIVFIVLAAILVAIITWWYMNMISRAIALKSGLVFGIVGFLTSIVTAFITGVCGVLIQTASFPTLFSVLPNFGTYLWSWQTLILLGYWVIPAVIIGWAMGARSGGAQSQSGVGAAGSERTL